MPNTRIFITKLIQCIFLIWTSTSIAQYQSYRDILLSKETTDATKIKKVDSLLAQNIRDQQYDDLGLIARRFSNWYYIRDMFTKAVATLHVSIIYHNPDNAIEDLQHKFFELGFFNYRAKDYKNSTNAYKKAIKTNDSNSIAGQAYYKIAANYYKLGDYELSRTYYELSEKVFLKLKNYRRLVKSYPFSYNTYSEIESSSASKKLEHNLLKADSIASTITIPDEDLYNIKKALSSYYNDYSTRNLEKGLPYAFQTLELAKKIKDSSKISRAYIKLGILNDHLHPQKALNFHQKALKYCPITNTKLQSIIYTNLGLNNIQLEKYKLAIAQQLLSLRIYTKTDFKNTSTVQSDSILHQKFNDINLRSKLANLGESYLLYAEKIKNKDTLNEAIKYFKLAEKTSDIYHKNSKTNTSKLIWQKKTTEMYGRALKACYLANDYTNALAFMEKNKALLLYEEQKKQKKLQEFQLPESYINKERYLTNKLNEYSGIKNKDITILKEQISYHDSLIAHTDSIKSIHKDLQLDFNNIPYDKIKFKIKENEAIVQYHTPSDNGYGIYPNATNGYGILITKKKTHLFEINDIHLLKDHIKDLQAKNTSPVTTYKEIQEYNILAHNIYQKLFPSEEIRNTIKGKKITVIPDNYLTTIPFESLIVSLDIQNDYLIKHSQINYKYSYTFHEEISTHKNSKKTHLAAFAPIDFNSSSLPSLLRSQEEVNNITSYFNSDIYSGVQANKATFNEALKTSTIIHLATHANATDSITPWIAFSDEKLDLHELYRTKNNADLVFLSACNTSTGKIETGEGTMSLSRGFFYGGAQSTVSSLWKVDDKSTQYIVNAFYKNLQEGASKSLALHKAKIEYLNNHTGSELAPYYWASFLLHGDVKPLPKKDWIWYYIAAGSLSIVLLVFLSRKRKQQFQKNN